MEKLGVRLLLLFVGAIALSGCASTARIVSVDEIKSSKDVKRGGIMFYLPKTVLSVTIPVIRIEKKEGEYASCARLLLGVEGITQSSVKYQIGEPKITTFGRRDLGQAYYLFLPGGPLTANDLTLETSSDGTFSKGVTDQENKTADFVVSTIEVTGKIASTVIKGFGARDSKPEELAQMKRQAAVNMKIPNDIIEFGTKVDNLTGDSRDSAINQNPKYWETWLAFNNQFNEMLDIRSNVKNLASGRANILEQLGTSEQKTAALDLLDAEVARASEKLIGVTTKTVWTGKIEIEPADFSMRSDIPQETFDLFDLVEAGSGAGISNLRRGFQPTLPENFFGRKAENSKTTELVLSSSPPPTTAASNIMNSKKTSKSFRYRIPVEAKCTLLNGGKTLAQEKVLVGQYGKVCALPASTGSMKTHWDVALDPVTGALTKLILNNKNFDPALVGRVGDSANTVVGAVSDRELTRVQREHDILKAKSETQGYRKILAGEAATDAQ